MSYSYDEKITIYVITYNNPNDLRSTTDIIACSKNKNLAKFYIEFHKCKYMKLRTIIDYPKYINEHIINNNINCEIQLAPMNSKIYNKNTDSTYFIVPVTELELTDLNEFSGFFCDGLIDYKNIHLYYSYLKNKYRKALDIILLGSVIKDVLFTSKKQFSNENWKEHEEMTITNIEMDNIALLYLIEPHLFEK